MAIVDQKRKTMSDVSALNVLTDDFPKFKTSDSFPSINNDGSSIDFLIDLIKSLVGYEELKSNVIDIFTRKMPEIEADVKANIKSELKSLVSCGVNPTIPNCLANGSEFKITNIDFFDLMKTDPTSEYGSLLYDDVTSGLASTDFNTFLYENIKINRSGAGIVSDWNSIMDIEFSPVGTTTNNVIRIQANTNYLNGSLIDFNNDYVDSINLFSSSKTLTDILDTLYGSVGITIGKSKKQLKREAEIDMILDYIINANENDVIDNSYFEFTNPQLAEIESLVNQRSDGIKILETCGNLPVSIPIELVTEVNDDINDAILNPPSGMPVEQSEVIAVENAIDQLATQQADYSPNPIDRPTIKINFILDLIKKFVKAIVHLILSPKLLVLFGINHKIMYGCDEEYNGAIDFLKKNKDLIIALVKTVSVFIVKMLLVVALKAISVKLAKKHADDEKEKSRNFTAQILSLAGAPPDVIKQIQGLGYIGG